ncbi:MAG: hypothetical protein AAFO07_25075, partial [Bacteroidota bacterium]
MRNRFAFLLLLLPFIHACTSEQSQDVWDEADFSFISTSMGEEAFQLGIWGGADVKKLKVLDTSNVKYEVKKGQLELDYQTAGYFQVLSQVIKLPKQWPNVSEISLEITAEQSMSMIFELYGLRSRLQDTLFLTKGKNNLIIDTREIPLLGGLNQEITQLKFIALQKGKLSIHHIKLHQTEMETFLVDRWGQRQLNDFPSKINQEDQLRDTLAEKNFLRQLTFDFQRDEYGGFIQHQLDLTASGFFHTQQVNG